MTKYLPVIAVLLGILMAAQELKAQDPEFTQFYANPLYLNPAFAGTSEGARFALNYRNQWPKVSNTISTTYATYSASYDQHFDKLGGGIGLQTWYDRAGDGRLSTWNIGGIYSYNIVINDHRQEYFIIKTALQASAFQRKIDFTGLHFPDEIDPRFGFIHETRENMPVREITPIMPDFSIGALAFTRKFYGGFAIHHIIEPTQSFFRNPNSVLPRKYTAHVGMQVPIDYWKREPTAFISPNILFQRQAKFTQVNFGAFVTKNFFLAGLSYRQTSPNSDALNAMVGFTFERVKIGYSYDITVSDARTAATGSHEVSVVIELEKPPKRQQKWRPIPCPGFN